MPLILKAMKLLDWLKAQERRVTQDELGRRVGLTQGRISQIANNGTNDLKTALAIEAATEREVTVADLLMPEKPATEPADDTNPSEAVIA